MRIRFGGLGCWLLAAIAGTMLFRSVGAGPRHDATLVELFLALATFVPASIGTALLLVGRALFEPMPPPVGRCRCSICREARAR